MAGGYTLGVFLNSQPLPSKADKLQCNFQGHRTQFLNVIIIFLIVILPKLISSMYPMYMRDV